MQNPKRLDISKLDIEPYFFIIFFAKKFADLKIVATFALANLKSPGGGIGRHATLRG